MNAVTRWYWKQEVGSRFSELGRTTMSACCAVAWLVAAYPLWQVHFGLLVLWLVPTLIWSLRTAREQGQGDLDSGAAGDFQRIWSVEAGYWAPAYLLAWVLCALEAILQMVFVLAAACCIFASWVASGIVGMALLGNAGVVLMPATMLLWMHWAYPSKRRARPDGDGGDGTGIPVLPTSPSPVGHFEHREALPIR